MRRAGRTALAIPLLALGLGGAASPVPPGSPEKVFPLDSLTGLRLVNVKGGTATYRGRRATSGDRADAPPVVVALREQ